MPQSIKEVRKKNEGIGERSLKLTECRIDVVMLPTRRPHRWTGIGENTIGHYPIIRLYTDNGFVGLGEAPVLPTWGGDYGRYYGEDIATTIHIIQDILFPTIKGEDPVRLEELLTKMDSMVAGYPYAKAAIDMALLDIIGKSLGEPVYRYLGGEERGRNLLVSHSIGLLDPEASAREAKEAVKDGIRAIKVKIGTVKNRDAETVAAVRAAIGSGVILGVDANRGYRDTREAIHAINIMSKENLSYVEQPVEGIANLAAISKSTDVPIIADESAWSVQDVLEIVERKAASGVSVYTTKPGGLFRGKKVLDVCKRFDLMCNINGSCETGVGNAANLHLGCSSDAVNMPCVVPVTNIDGRQLTKVGGVFYNDDIITEPFDFVGGRLSPNDRPGLGVKLDESKVEKYRSKFYPRVYSSS